MSYFVYLLRCKDGSFYTGITTDLNRRMSEHDSGKGSKYVAVAGFDELLFALKSPDRSDASKLEYRIKQLEKFEKLAFFREHPSCCFNVFENE